MKKENLTAGLIVLALFLAFTVGYYGSETTIKDVQTHFMSMEKPVFVSNSSRIAVKSMEIPAVSKEGKGITGDITVIIREGNGMINMDVSNLLIKEDTESSLRKGAHYAFENDDKNLTNYDVIYHIETDAPAIEGTSAGASAAVLTTAALKNRSINKSVMMTGTVHHDGDIGPADKVIPKGKAAANANKSLFLVPRTQSIKRNVSSEKYCRRYGGTEFCSNEYTPRTIDVEEEVGISVKEVSSVEEATEYFFKSE